MATNGGFLINQGEVLVKTETTVGVDAVPTPGSNALTAYNIKIEPLGQSESSTRQPLMGPGVMGVQTPIAGKRYSKFSMQIPVVGAAGAGTAVAYAALLKACGISEAVVASTSVTYADAGASSPCTIYVYAGPGRGTATYRLYKIFGFSGNVKISGDDGKEAMWHFEGMGAYVDPTDASAPAAPTLTEVAAASLLGVAVSLNFGSSYSPVLKSFEVDFGSDVKMSEDMTQGGGYRSGLVVNRIPKFTFDMEEDLAANFDPYALWDANTPGVITVGPVGSGAGLIWTLTIARAGIEKPDVQAGDGILRCKLTGQCARSVAALTTPAAKVVFT
jgi:hypothetical protein